MKRFEKIYQEALNQTTTIDPKNLQDRLTQNMKGLDPNVKNVLGTVTGAVEDATIDPEQQILKMIEQNPQILQSPKIKELFDKIKNSDNSEINQNTNSQNPTLTQVQKATTPSSATSTMR